MSYTWNFRDPLRRGYVAIAKSGREHYGTVIKSGYNKKTIVVKVNAPSYNFKYGAWTNKPSRFHVHDERELGRVGDKVIIRTCFPITRLKHYYLKSFVWMSPRQNFVVNNFLQFEKDALLYNEKLRNKCPTRLSKVSKDEMLKL